MLEKYAGGRFLRRLGPRRPSRCRTHRLFWSASSSSVLWIGSFGLRSEDLNVNLNCEQEITAFKFSLDAEDQTLSKNFLGGNSTDFFYISGRFDDKNKNIRVVICWKNTLGHGSIPVSARRPRRPSRCRRPRSVSSSPNCTPTYFLGRRGPAPQ